ncbi:MAG: hypothetical protein EPN33_01380 [Acidobacteria bacterium]|nr:MAG: hypothetical protein EPN33_01380 [Acidobacteriota bacterium]
MRGCAKQRSSVPPWAWALVGAGATAAMVWARRRARALPRELLLRATITIQAPAARIYELWRDPHVHAQLRQAKVTPLAGNGANWRFRRDFPNGGHITGEIHLTHEQPSERLEWVTENLQILFRPGLPVRHWRQLGGARSGSGRTLPGIEVRTPSDQRERPGQKVASHLRVSPRGLLQLRPCPRRSGEAECTEVQLRFAVLDAPSLPWVRARIAAGMRTSLRRLRSLAETGALATTTGQPAGRRSRKGRVLLRILKGPQFQPERKVG